MPPVSSPLAVAKHEQTTDLKVAHKDLANAIRFLAADAVEAAKSGHPGMPMGMADVATVLFTQFLKFDAEAPDWADRDRFVLSAGHGSMLLYALLYLTGSPAMTVEQLKKFRQLGSLTPGHPEYGHTPGVEVTTGPLGQGLAMSVGLALAERHLNAKQGDAIVDHRTYVIAGDGDLMEGVSQEAISLAGHLRLNKLIVLFDDNRISIDGPTDLSTSDDQLARFAASGWSASRVDGHDPVAIAAAIKAAQSSDRPSLIACRTIIGYGAPKKQGSASTHGSPLGADEIAAARAKLGWPHAAFEVPAEVLAEWRAAGKRGRETRLAWEKRAGKPAVAKDWTQAFTAYKQKIAAEGPKWATRQASGEALEVLMAEIPELVGGSADLTGSVNTKTKAVDLLNAKNYGGRYIHYGIREFAMGAVMNGMSLHGGIIPFGGTFLVFADYMRPAIRLSALMGQRVIYVLTHDSIGLGEDGPTHQPVETLASLRAIPNLQVIRPADAVETAEAWDMALAKTDGPTALVLTRQGVPPVRKETADNKVAKGGYVVAEADGARKATLIATGSEIGIAIAARDALQAAGIPTAVVSLPSWELFDKQDAAYRAQVLGAQPRIAVEAAVKMGWERYLRETDGFVGMSGFGASAPAGDLYKHFGITAEAVVQAVKQRL
jgi:transketolase